MILLTDETNEQAAARQANEYREARRVKCLAELANLQRTLNSRRYEYIATVTNSYIHIEVIAQDAKAVMELEQLGFAVSGWGLIHRGRKVLKYD